MGSQVYGAGTQGSSFYDTADSSTRQVNYLLRFITLATAFVAAVVMGVARETKPFPNSTADDFRVKATAASQFEYFITVNAIVCFYSAASLAMWVITKGRSKGLVFALTMLDLVMVAFLFSGTGSAAAFGVLLRKGSGELYPRICNVYSKFCGQTSAAIVISMFTAISYLALAALSYLNLYKKSL